MDFKKNVYLFLILILVSPCLAGEIGFIEKFSLSEDRTEPLAKLIPGTPDYYYYHCLHYQHTEQLQKVHDTLTQWIKRHGYTSRVREILNRQALLEYRQNPEKSLAYIKKRLSLRFNHQKLHSDTKTNYTHQFNQQLISRETLTRNAFSNYSNLDGFEDSALDFLITGNLNPDHRRELLRRLKRPDHPNLPVLVVEDLKYRHSRGFGSHPIHRLMLLAQLDTCLTLMPELKQKTNFVHAYLTKQHPCADVDWRRRPREKDAYLTRLWTFVQYLPPAMNSLKAHVLYHRLFFNLGRNVYDKTLFLEYLKLPRSVSYINQDFIQRKELQTNQADLSTDFSKQTLMAPVGSDEALIRNYLQHFFIDASGIEEFAPFIHQDYLKEVFAESKILHGIGDMEQWYSMLSPTRLKALKERVDLVLLPSNQNFFKTNEPVVLDVAVKNVSILIIKTYEINTFNYYKEKQEEISTGVDLDGLVANKERVVNYKEIPLRRHVQRFEFPEIDRQGVFVIEFIGNGRSSRAVIHKGRLAFTQRMGSAGHIFTVYNEDNNTLDKVTLWLAGHAYESDKHGEICVPFSNKPGKQIIIIRRGDFAALHQFQHQSENYSLEAGIYADGESLLSGRSARVLIRSELTLNGQPMDINLLEDATLVIESVDMEGISTSKEVGDFKLFNHQDSVYEFRVPENLSRISFALKGKVMNLSKNRKLDLFDSRSFELNGIDKTAQIEDLHVRHVNGRYILELLGKTGEPRPARVVHLELKHHHFKRKVTVTLQTDGSGHIDLGLLKKIDSVTARLPGGVSHTWSTIRDLHSYSTVVHGVKGTPVTIPFMQKAPVDISQAVSLLEIRGHTFVKDYRSQVSFKEGFLVIDDLPAGDFDLLLKSEAIRIRLKISEGQPRGGIILSRDRFLQLRPNQPLQISRIEGNGQSGKMMIHLKNVTPSTRVHVVATRFLPANPMFQLIGSPAGSELTETRIRQIPCLYVSGRDIGDEYRYILERKYATVFPGNMLRRPGLLLNPWSLRKTDTGRQEAEKGEAWEGRPGGIAGGEAGRGAYGADTRAAPGALSQYANLDFLHESSLVFTNLIPDSNGVVSFDADGLGSRRQLHVFAVNDQDAVYREKSFPDSPGRYLDLRLRTPLNSEKHYTEQMKVSPVQPEQTFVIEDITISRMEVYDSLAAVYALLATLSNDPTLAEFGFILGWPDLAPEKKQELYSKYACHELNFFLFKKDPAFFESVIKPYLANKKDKTFMDFWLLDDPLTPFLASWPYSRLNIVESILLGRRLAQQQETTLRHATDLYDLLPPDSERDIRLFKTGLKGSALATGDHLGYKRAAEEVPQEILGALKPPPGKVKPSKSTRALQQLKKKEDNELVDLDESGITEKFTLVAGIASAKDVRARDALRRRQARQFYRKLEKTEEWVENNYYHLPIEQQLADLITVNGFWKDYAASHTGEQPFLSGHIAEASRNFTEIMFALAVLDLPFKAPEQHPKYDGQRMTFTSTDTAVIFHREIKEAAPAENPRPLLVSQNFFARDDRYRYEGNQRLDRFVTDEFQTHRVYGCQVVLTNPTSAPRKVDILLQIPAGAMPVLNGFTTRSVHFQLQPYAAKTIEYFFYFPLSGDYAHYPVHVAHDQKVIAFTPPFTFNVLDKLTKIDKSSWQYVSQNGSSVDVFAYLKQHNVHRLDLSLMAFRLRDGTFFKKIIQLLHDRHIYNDIIWSYGVYHNHVPAIRQFLQNSSFAGQCGLFIDSPLLTLDPVARHVYQHREYLPLVNARIYQLGKKRRILNNQFHQQYNHFLRFLSYRPRLDDADRLTVSFYVLLQDRIEEGLQFFKKIDPSRLDTVIQYDYLNAFLAFYEENPVLAGEIAQKYREYPVDRWRKLFLEVLAQANEIEGNAATLVDEESRDQIQTRLADTEPSFDFHMEGRNVFLQYRNLEECRINYYLMDIELLFSRNPFVQEVSGHFSIVRPTESAVLTLPGDGNEMSFELPRQYHDHNVMLEIIGGGQTLRQPYYPHSMNIQLMENYGQVRVTDAQTHQSLSKVYIKVYARMKNGNVEFYKDGTTDLRGRFDYASLSTNQLEGVSRFSILFVSEKHGTVIRETAPPKQ